MPRKRKLVRTAAERTKASRLARRGAKATEADGVWLKAYRAGKPLPGKPIESGAKPDAFALYSGNRDPRRFVVHTTRQLPALHPPQWSPQVSMVDEDTGKAEEVGVLPPPTKPPPPEPTPEEKAAKLAASASKVAWAMRFIVLKGMDSVDVLLRNAPPAQVEPYRAAWEAVKEERETLLHTVEEAAKRLVVKYAIPVALPFEDELIVGAAVVGSGAAFMAARQLNEPRPPVPHVVDSPPPPPRERRSAFTEELFQ